MRTLLALAVTTSLLGCNAVLGLDEGTLDDGSGGTTATGASPSTATGSGDTSGTATTDTAGSNATATTATTGENTTSTGSACVLQTDLRNGDFSSWSDGDLLGWFFSGNLTSDSFAQPIVEGQGGLKLVVSGANDLDDFAGFWQQNILDPMYFECLEVRGTSRKTGGDGRLTVDVRFDGRHLEAEMPTGAQMAPFAKACKLPAATDFYTAYLQVDRMPGEGGAPGGAVVEVERLEVNHICCDGVVDTCPLLEPQ